MTNAVLIFFSTEVVTVDNKISNCLSGTAQTNNNIYL